MVRNDRAATARRLSVPRVRAPDTVGTSVPLGRSSAVRVGVDVMSLGSFHGVDQRGLGDVPAADLPYDPAVPYHQDPGAQGEQVLGVGRGHDHAHPVVGLTL